MLVLDHDIIAPVSDCKKCSSIPRVKGHKIDTLLRLNRMGASYIACVYLIGTGTCSRVHSTNLIPRVIICPVHPQRAS